MTTATATRTTISAARALLAAAVTAADAVAPSTATKPILTNIEMRGEGGRLAISATNGEVAVRVQVSGVTVEAGEPVIVSAHRLHQVLAASASASVTMGMEGTDEAQTLHVALADGDFRLRPVIGEVFPTVAGMPADGGLLTLPGSALADLFEKVAFAADKDRASAVLSGVLVEVGSGEVLVAATDGKMLAESKLAHPSIAAPSADGERRRAVLPVSALAMVGRIASCFAVKSMELALPGQNAVIRLVGEGITCDLTMRTIAGIYPAYAGALNIGADTSTATIPRQALTDALKRVAVLMDGKNCATVLTLEGDSARVSPLNQANGSATVTVACQTTEARRHLGVNGTYLLDILRHHGGESVTMHFSRGIVIRGGTSTYLLMPIALPT